MIRHKHLWMYKTVDQKTLMYFLYSNLDIYPFDPNFEGNFVTVNVCEMGSSKSRVSLYLTSLYLHTH